MTGRTRLLAVVLSCCLAACDASPNAEQAVSANVAGSTVTVALGDRPFKLRLPTSYAAGKIR
jgi:hypothetical protein